MRSLSRTARLLAATLGLVAWLAAVPAAARSQDLVVARIHDLQGAAHLSPFSGQDVSGVEGVVTVERSTSFWMQDPTPDTDEATSEGVLVFGSGVGALVTVGDHVSVSGRVLEFRPGGATGTDNLTTTEITTPGLSVEHLFKRVRAGVVEATKGKQMPWESSSLMGDFFFAPQTTSRPATAGGPAPLSVPAQAAAT